MDITIVPEQSFLRGMVKVRAMVHGSDLGGGAAEHLGPPGVEVRVKVDHAHGAVGAVDAPQEREGDGVVASQRDDAR